MDSPGSGRLISVTPIKVHLAIAHLWGVARTKHEVRLSKPTYNCSPSTDSSRWARDREEYWVALASVSVTLFLLAESAGEVPTYLWGVGLRPDRPARGAAVGRKHLLFWRDAANTSYNLKGTHGADT